MGTRRLSVVANEYRTEQQPCFCCGVADTKE